MQRYIGYTHNIGHILFDEIFPIWKMADTWGWSEKDTQIELHFEETIRNTHVFEALTDASNFHTWEHMQVSNGSSD